MSPTSSREPVDPALTRTVRNLYNEATTTTPPAPPPPATRPPAAPDEVLDAYRRRYRRGRIRQAALVASDVVALVAPLLVLNHNASPLDGADLPATALWPVVLIWLATFHLYGLYPRWARHITTSTLNELPHVFHGALVSLVLTWTWLTAWGAEGLGHPLAVFALTALVLLPTFRAVTRRLLTAGLGPENLLLVGTGTTTARAERALRARNDIHVVDSVPLPRQWRRELDEEDPSRHELEDVIARRGVDRVLLSTKELGDRAVSDFLHWSRRANVSLTVLPEHFDVVGVGASFDQIQGGTVISLQPPNLSHTSRLLKRALDFVGAVIGLVVLSPLMLAVALAVRADSRGPVLFLQDRVGRGGRVFRLAKFRTMVPEADAQVEELMARSTDPHWLQIENDPRVTRLGRWLRSTSLDELPQLWCVLRGHMSLVGPRPLSVRDDARVGGWARGRLDLTPGLTGLWQVVGRKSVPFEEMVRLDYLYVSNWSLWGDLKILVATLPAVMLRRGAR
jgi:exopolysaccharide biosynthesis polyprenyl glycosylphosphotransferase